MSTYKQQYSPEEVNELIEWFKARENKLPDSLQVDKATYIKDLKRTLTLYYDIAREHISNPTYSGQINHLLLIREALNGKI